MLAKRAGVGWEAAAGGKETFRGTRRLWGKTEPEV